MTTKKKKKPAVKAKKRKSSVKPKSKMPTKKRKTVTRSGSATRHTKKRRRTGGLAATGRNILAAAKPTLAGAAGGVAYLYGGQMVPVTSRPWVGIAAAILLTYSGLNNVGVGMAGAAAFDFTSRLSGLSDMEPVDYVQPTILSDSYSLSDSETMDEAGNVYQLSDDGQNLEYVGTLESAYQQGLQMNPLYTG